MLILLVLNFTDTSVWSSRTQEKLRRALNL